MSLGSNDDHRTSSRAAVSVGWRSVSRGALRPELAALAGQIRTFPPESGWAESSYGADRQPGCCTGLLYCRQSPLKMR